ncbi:hypothetical protein SEPCBS119000_004632 [Sporothrix epigloea]|uniref:Zn(2)-C6 fungal-type domain-containing protein n=1 Tax=Sporothrix epigloea TaxID=1892477 RepID=A0ABP0DX66_9PEZI
MDLQQLVFDPPEAADAAPPDSDIDLDAFMQCSSDPLLTPAGESVGSVAYYGCMASATPEQISPWLTSPGASSIDSSLGQPVSGPLPLSLGSHHPHYLPQQSARLQPFGGSLSSSLGSSLGATPGSITVSSNNISSSDSVSHSKRLERRGHTKSRRGCFNCKRRRIKCQETRPACGHCLKMGLQCEYPVAPLIPRQPQYQMPLFSLQDMRFFQHFLLHCSPHYPLGNQSLWTHEIPCLSHTHDYLMHALLGMAASDLMQHDPSLVTAAMDHRLKAIRAIKRTLDAVPKWPPAGLRQQGQADSDQRRDFEKSPGSHAQPHGRSGEPCDQYTGPRAPGMPTFEEGNALVASCLALTFQSVALDDGMAEYMTFIRGIIVVAVQMYLGGARVMFSNLLGGEQTELLRPAMAPMPIIDRQWTMAALTSIQRLAPLCAHDDIATAYHALVTEMAESLLVSPMEAYSAMTRHYAWWMQLPQEQFRRVVDLDKQIFVLLASHWIALKQIMKRITSQEKAVSESLSKANGNEASAVNVPQGQPRPTSSPMRSDGLQGKANGSMDSGIVKWLKHLNRLVQPEYLAFNRWPTWVEEELDRDNNVFA